MATASKSTAIKGANCTCPSPTVLNPRSVRAGRILHHIKGGVAVLVGSSAPRQWIVLVSTGTSWRVARWSTGAAENYHEAAGLSKLDIPEPDPAALTTSLDSTGVAYDPDVMNAALSQSGDGAVPGDETPKSRGSYTPRAKRVSPTSGKFTPPAVNAGRYWYESENDAKFFNDFVALRRAGHVANAMIVGPSGFGKTVGVLELGKRLGVPVHVVGCQVITTPEKWLGQMQVGPTAEGGTHTYFEVSNHVQWVERTHEDCKDAEFCIILYDEITRLRPELGNMLFSMLDEQKGLEVPQMNRSVKMNDNNVVFATANIGAAYAGTFTMDWALRGRFNLQIERPMPPTNEETKILTSATGVAEDDAKALIRVAEHTRKLWKLGELESPISTRTLVTWALLIAGGYPIKEAAEYTVVPLYNEDGGSDSDRARVKMAIDGKVAS